MAAPTFTPAPKASSPRKKRAKRRRQPVFAFHLPIEVELLEVGARKPSAFRCATAEYRGRMWEFTTPLVTGQTETRYVPDTFVARLVIRRPMQYQAPPQPWVNQGFTIAPQSFVTSADLMTSMPVEAPPGPRITVNPFLAAARAAATEQPPIEDGRDPKANRGRRIQSNTPVPVSEVVGEDGAPTRVNAAIS